MKIISSINREVLDRTIQRAKERNIILPTFAQDEESSVAWGMPGAAVRYGGAEHVLPPHRIAQVLARIVLEK